MRLKLPGGDRSKGSGVLCPSGHELSFNDAALGGRVARSLSAIRWAARHRERELPRSPVASLHRGAARWLLIGVALRELGGDTSHISGWLSRCGGFRPRLWRDNRLQLPSGPGPSWPVTAGSPGERLRL